LSVAQFGADTKLRQRPEKAAFQDMQKPVTVGEQRAASLHFTVRGIAGFRQKPGRGIYGTFRKAV